MLRYMLTYGAISAAIIAASSLFFWATKGTDHGDGSVFVGYLTMLVALSLIFVGLKRYRDKEKGGVIKFLPALGFGLGITAVAGVAYVAAWEVYLASTDYSFAPEYVAAVLEKARAGGASEAALQAQAAELGKFVEQYKNPLFRLPLSFIEIFPVGLVVALVSAGVLRNPKAFPAKI